MKRIMFVCHGNICRSPLAEFLFREMVKEKGLESEIFVDSSAVSAEEEGNPVYPPIRKILAERGISTAGKYAKTLMRRDYPLYDLFVAMDSSNIRNIGRIFGNDPDKKVKVVDGQLQCE